MDFEIFHLYQRLVRRNLVKPLCCSHCNNPWITRIGKNDEPEFQCVFCNTRVTPGLSIYRDMEAVVKEHFA